MHLTISAKNKILPLLFAIILVVASSRCSSGAPPLNLDKIKLPPGFKIEIYSSSVPGARSLALGDDGTVFVGTRDEGVVYALVDRKKVNRADEVIKVAKWLNMPNGVAFRNGSLYVAEINRIIRYDNIEKRLRIPPRRVVVNDSFPSDRHHGWKFIRFGPDDLLYVAVGAPCNVCERRDPRYATIMRMKPDGTQLETFASGIRNSVGFDWDPKTKELWFTDNGRDNLGDDLPPDELNHAPRIGLNFGFPYCYGRNIPDPEFNDSGKCVGPVPPALELGPHVAPLGMRFYTGKMFPFWYQTRIFIAEHGSWNRSVPAGYRIMTVRFRYGRPQGYEVFASGWLQGGKAWGRPVDVLQMPDGALLVSDDKAGAVYRISYVGSAKSR